MSEREVGLVVACRASGLTRHQLRYLEEKGLLGDVRRNGANDRRYSLAQLEVLKGVGLLRRSGIGVDEAAALAAEEVAGAARLPTERVRFLTGRLISELEPKHRAVLLLHGLLARRAGM